MSNEEGHCEKAAEAVHLVSEKQTAHQPDGVDEEQRLFRSERSKQGLRARQNSPKLSSQAI